MICAASQWQWVGALLTHVIINYWSSLQLGQSHKLSLSAKHSKAGETSKDQNELAREARKIDRGKPARC